MNLKVKSKKINDYTYELAISAKWEDIKADIEIHKSKKEYVPNKAGIGIYGKIHTGFRDALEDIWKDLMKIMTLVKDMNQVCH